ncbi:restriction endonuclease subunit S [Corynebacterium aurimucosum]
MVSTAKHDWPMVRLGDVVEILNGFAFSSKSFGAEGDMPIIRIRDVVPGSTSTYYSGEWDKKYLIQPGEILVGMDGDFNYARWKSEPALLNQRVCKVSADEQRIIDSYLFHALQFPLRDIWEKTAFVTVKHLSAKRLAEALIPLPPLDEQRRIAAILDAVAESIAAVKSQLAELSAIPFSMSNQKPQLIALSELVDIRSSQVDPTSEPYLTMPHVAPNNLYSGSDEIVGVKSAAEDGVTSGKYAFKSGDILYSKIRPYLNKVSVAAYDGVCSADMYALVPRDIKQTDWIVWQLRSSRFLAYAAASSGRASIPKINRKTLGAFKVQVADPMVLERFNREQSTKKSLADSMRRKLNLFQKLQESLSTRAFQGEL